MTSGLTPGGTCRQPSGRCEHGSQPSQCVRCKSKAAAAGSVHVLGDGTDLATDIGAPSGGRRDVLTLLPGDRIEAGTYRGHRAIRFHDDGPHSLVIVLPDDADERRALSHMLAGALVLAEALELP